MRRLFALVLGTLFGAALMYMAFQYHVVRTPDRVLLVRKQQTSLTDAYVDIRNWSFREWRDHPELARAMFHQGHGDLIESSVEEGLFRQFFSRLRDGSWLDRRTER